jgi:ATP-dependent DNA ligase
MSILDILNELASVSNRSAKEAILKREQYNSDLKKVIVAALNPYVNYYIKKIDHEPSCTGSIGIGQAILELENLTQRKVTGNAAKAFLNSILDACSKDDAEVVRRIIERDLKCGINVSTVNKIWHALVPTFDVMLADTDKSKIKFPAYAQVKMDGVRCHIYWDGNQALAFSRNGKPIDHKGKLNESARMLMSVGQTWDGELVCVNDDNTFMNRQTSNGIINKAIKGTITEDEADKIIFTTWDIVDFTSTIPYEKRLRSLTEAFDRNGSSAKKFRLIDNRMVSNMRQAEECFKEALMNGEEGIILKNIHSMWQPKRVKDLCKFKAEAEADLRVIGWEYGTGKNANRLGNLILGTDDGQLKVSVGTGFSDAQRDEYTQDAIMGKIVTVKYNTKIRDEFGAWSLFLPRFVEVRFDKDETNTINELV